jgi:tetratricopeptide (TPR) repeat protein
MPALRCPRHLPCVLAVAVLSTAPALSQPPSAGAVNATHEELKHQADDAYRTRSFSNAIELASRVLDENPSDPVALYLRASSRVEQGIASNSAELVRSGIEDARSAISHDTQKKADYYLPYLFGMSHLTKLEGSAAHAETAVRIATQVLERAGLDQQISANLTYQRGVAHAALADYEQAIADFRSALEMTSTHLGARLALSEALVRSGDLQAAEESLNAAAEAFPSSPLVFNNRGMFHQSQGRGDSAVADFTKALTLDPDFTQAYLNRGFALIQNGDPQAAIADLDLVLERQPENAAAFSLRGTARLRNGDHSGAVEDYTRAVELDSANPAARADLGFAYFFAGDYETAAAAFDQSLTLQPKNEFLKPWRYTALVRSSQEAAARSSYATLAERPVEEQSWFDALTLMLMGELTEKELVARVDSSDPRLKEAQLCEAWYFLGVSKQDENPEEADAYFRRALRSQARQLSAWQAAKIAVGDAEPPR